VGPPGHRGLGVLPQDDALRAAGFERDLARHARRVGPGRCEGAGGLGSEAAARGQPPQLDRRRILLDQRPERRHERGDQRRREGGNARRGDSLPAHEGRRLTLVAPDILAIVFGAVGVVWGLISDRIGARWPAHEDGSIRPVDWRSVVTPLVGGIALFALPSRFSDPVHLALFCGYFLALILLLATDLDQRLLPDVITLPLIPITAVAAISGINPLVAGQVLPAVVAAIAIPGLLYLLSIPFGAGAIGVGDLKLLVSVGLLTGLGRATIGVIAGALLSGVVILVLLATRRVTLRSYIPFGPFLIIGAFWSVLASV
jgi:leader peptidase (prepilin peptidase)/N-methyltransferase